MTKYPVYIKHISMPTLSTHVYRYFSWSALARLQHVMLFFPQKFDSLSVWMYKLISASRL